MKKPFFWIVVVTALYAAHQDLWFWHSARPFLAGFLPIGLTYHAIYCLAASALLWLLTTYAWPWHLEDSAAYGAAQDRGRRR